MLLGEFASKLNVFWFKLLIECLESSRKVSDMIKRRNLEWLTWSKSLLEIDEDRGFQTPIGSEQY
jgi:hypothetical protein